MPDVVVCPACRRSFAIDPGTAAAGGEVRCPDCGEPVPTLNVRQAVTTEPGVASVALQEDDEAARRLRRRQELMEEEDLDIQVGGLAARRYRSGTNLARWARILFWIDAGLLAVTVICDSLQLKMELDLANGGPFADGSFTVVGLVNGLAGFIYNFTYMGAAIVFVVWLHRMYTNLVPLCASPKYSPAWTVAFWFIPFANLIMPVFVVQEIWRSSDPDPNRTFADVPPSWFVRLWWTTWLLMNFLGIAVVVYALVVVFQGIAELQQGGVVPPGGPAGAEQFIGVTALSVAMSAVTLISTLLAAQLVGRIDARVSARAAAMFGSEDRPLPADELGPEA